MFEQVKSTVVKQLNKEKKKLVPFVFDLEEYSRLIDVETTKKNKGEVIYAAILCHFERISLTIRFVKKLNNHKYYVK
jgi:hypothetical protein